MHINLQVRVEGREEGMGEREDKERVQLMICHAFWHLISLTLLFLLPSLPPFARASGSATA